MDKPKPISFRPDELDEYLLNGLMEHFKTDAKADMLRRCIFNFAQQTFGDEFGDMLVDYRSQSFDKK